VWGHFVLCYIVPSFFTTGSSPEATEQIAWDLVHFLRRELVSRGKEKRERGMGYGAETVSHSLSINLTQDGSNVAPVAPFLQPSICGGGVVTDHDDQGKKGRRKKRIRREGAGKARLAVLALQQVHTHWWDVGIVVEENSGSISQPPS